jgi:hypothetical protein
LRNFNLASPKIFSLRGSDCSQPFFFPAAVEPAVLTDLNFGTLQYGDPFPSNWTRELAFCQSVTVPFQVGSQSFPIALNYGMTVAPSTPTLAPLAQPVVNPTINGSNRFTTTSVNNTVGTLSWSTANGTSPFGYTVCVFQVIPVQNGLELLVAGNCSTAQTSMTLPPPHRSRWCREYANQPLSFSTAHRIRHRHVGSSRDQRRSLWSAAPWRSEGVEAIPPTPRQLLPNGG